MDVVEEYCSDVDGVGVCAGSMEDLERLVGYVYEDDTVLIEGDDGSSRRYWWLRR